MNKHTQQLNGALQAITAVPLHQVIDSWKVLEVLDTALIGRCATCGLPLSDLVSIWSQALVPTCPKCGARAAWRQVFGFKHTRMGANQWAVIAWGVKLGLSARTIAHLAGIGERNVHRILSTNGWRGKSCA